VSKMTYEGEEGIRLRTKYMKLGVLLGLLLTFWLLEVVSATAAPLTYPAHLEPSVLTELGFLSNPVEGKYFGSPEFQRQSAVEIYQEILDSKL